MNPPRRFLLTLDLRARRVNLAPLDAPTQAWLNGSGEIYDRVLEVAYAAVDPTRPIFADEPPRLLAAAIAHRIRLAFPGEEVEVRAALVADDA